MTTRTFRPLPLTRSMLSLRGALAHGGAALESDRGRFIVAGIGAGLVLFVGIATTVRAASIQQPSAVAMAVLTSIGVGLSVAWRPSRPAAGWLATLAAVALVTAFSKASFDRAPSTVWLFAFVIPAIGLVRGAAQGAVAGAVSEPALRWIEMGTPIDLLDPSAPFGFLILISLGAVPAYLLSVAVGRRDALHAQLGRVEALLGEAEVARDAKDQAQQHAVFMLARAAEARDGTTGLHIHSVRDLAQELALAAGLGPEAAHEIAWSAMLHDVGKIRVPDRILLKPGLLTDEERALIQQHPAWGEELLAGQSDFALARSIARSHHENWDGTGYPDRRAGSDIPFPARIVRIVDVYDALRRDRPYKAAWSIERTVDEMRAMRGKSFDPELTDLFLAMATRTA